MARNKNQMRRDVQDLALRILVVHRDFDAALLSLREAQPGFPTQSMGGGGSTLSEDGTPAGLLRFVLRMDPASADLEQLDKRLSHARRELVEIQRIVTTWAQKPIAGDDEPKALTTFETDCIACHRYCSGAPSDRLRAGFCPACHSSWQRWRKANKGDRHAWLTLRRRQIAEAQVQAEAS